MKDIDNITDRDLAVLKSLTNPDDPREKKYRWDLRYQQEILSMLLMDSVFLTQSMQLIKPSYFVDKVHEVICSILFDYFFKYNKLPTKPYIASEIGSRYPNDSKKLLIYTGELEALTTSYIPGLESRDACLDKITEFAKEQALRYAVSVTLDLLEKGARDRWTKIESLFKQALLTDRNFDIGLDYFQTLEERYERMAKLNTNKEVFITGMDGIDCGLSAGGICRGELAAFLGASGSGKSMFLVRSAVRNFLRGKRILYISLEMDEDKLARRFDAMLSVGNIRTLLDRKEQVIAALKECVKGEEDKRMLIIKQFPAGTADVHTIRAFLSQLGLRGWKPDMMCVDYVGEMREQEGIKTYESRQRAVRDLRALAVEENFAVFTAMQANRRSKEDQDNVSVIDDSMLADSFGQARVCDAIWSINQSANEKAMNLGRIFVVKHRDGNSRYQIFFKQNKETLDFNEISQQAHGEMMSEFRVRKADSTEIVKVEGKKKFAPNEES